MRLGSAWLLLGLAAMAPARADVDVGGQLRLRWDERSAATAGPLATAAALVAPDVAPPQRDSLSLLSELRGRWRFISANAALDQVRPEGGPTTSRARFNELYASGEAFGWQFSAGRKIVGWDVGYGFRPNDMVQSEPRLQLLPGTPQGRAVVDAEHFDADTAWSFVWVNPQRPEDGSGSDEQALAARAYRRAGAADWYGFARWGEHTRGSLGAALAWVASDTLELHASARWAERVHTWAIDPAVGTIARDNPWRVQQQGASSQALIGASWTGENQLSLLAEAWYDGSAASDDRWQAWAGRNAGLANSLSPASPAALRGAVAGNLAWQAQAFGATSLRRRNLLLRTAWKHEKWQPALDLLYQPEDAGRVITASIEWQGDRVSIDAGLRQYGGPSSAVLAQLPLRRSAYLAATWSF